MEKVEDAYLGHWDLVPELCLYQEGHPPLSGSYAIEMASGKVRIEISWVAADRSHHSVEFGGPVNGVKQPSHQHGVTHVSFTRVDQFTLDTTAYVNDIKVAYARRRASATRDLLVTVQETRKADGSVFRNFQVYRRRPGK